MVIAPAVPDEALPDLIFTAPVEVVPVPELMLIAPLAPEALLAVAAVKV